MKVFADFGQKLLGSVGSFALNLRTFGSSSTQLEIYLHDLNNLLMAVGAHLERGVSSAPQVPEASRVSFEKAKVGITRCMQICSSVSRLKGASGGGQFEVGDVVELAIDLLPPTFSSAIQISHERITTGPMLARGDLLIVYRILSNLIINACQAILSESSFSPSAVSQSASPAPGSVLITTSADSHTVKIHVSDSGPGVPIDIRQRLFHKLGVTTKISQKVEFGGRGIGLYGARKLVRQLGGDLDLAPAIPGKGAEFVISLQRIYP